MSKIWFTSDTHFGHGNVIKYCNRPYRTSDEMDRSLIDNWNSVVQPQDIVYHLGDVGFMQEPQLINILQRLNGNKILIMGNHDKVIKRSKAAFYKCFGSIHDYYDLSHDGQKYVLSHYPMLSWNGSGRGSIMLHGHSHGTTNYGHLKTGKILDVGVDCHNYTPIDIPTVLRLMSSRVSEDFGRDR